MTAREPPEAERERHETLVLLQPPGGAGLANTLILDLQPLEPRGNNFLLFVPPSLRFFVTAAPGNSQGLKSFGGRRGSHG